MFSGELFRQSPVRVVALEDAVAVAIEAEGNAVCCVHGTESAEIADGIFGFDLEVSTSSKRHSLEIVIPNAVSHPQPDIPILESNRREILDIS